MPKSNPSVGNQLPNPMFRLGALVHGRDDIVHLEFGEPDFPTPAHIVEAAQRSLSTERQGYGPGNGIHSLREAIAARMLRVNGLAATPDEIVVAAGGTGALMTSLVTICAPGDEVLVPDPAWAGYDGMLAAAGARMVRYPLLPEHGWQPDLDALEAAITSRTTVLLMNTPSNPSGTVFSRQTVAALLEIAQRHDLWLLSDECYDEFVYAGEHVSPATLDTTARVITIGTCSKAYAMTGWRVGWAVVTSALARPLTLVASAQVNNLPLFTQRAAEAALTGPQDCVRAMADAYRARRDLALALLDQRGRQEYTPDGAFYLLVRVHPELSDASAVPFDGVAFAEALIQDKHIAVAPGIAFGPRTGAHIRISLASSPDALRAGIERLFDFAATYHQDT